MRRHGVARTRACGTHWYFHKHLAGDEVAMLGSNFHIFGQDPGLGTSSKVTSLLMAYKIAYGLIVIRALDQRVNRPQNDTVSMLTAMSKKSNLMVKQSQNCCHLFACSSPKHIVQIFIFGST